MSAGLKSVPSVIFQRRFQQSALIYNALPCQTRLQSLSKWAAADCNISEPAAARRRLGIGMTDLSLIPETAWREAKRRAEMPKCEYGRPAFLSAEGEFDNLLKLTLKNNTLPGSTHG